MITQFIQSTRVQRLNAFLGIAIVFYLFPALAGRHIGLNVAEHFGWAVDSDYRNYSIALCSLVTMVFTGSMMGWWLPSRRASMRKIPVVS